MKKAISLLLAIVMMLAFCACGTQKEDSAPHPLSANFQTEDELVAALETFFKSGWGGETEEDFTEAVKEVREVLKNNTSIHHYFQKSDEAIALAHRLCADGSIGELWARLVFSSCNTSEWYVGIANSVNEYHTTPLFFTAWYYDQPTYTTVADAIRDNFKGPLSVSVLSGEWLFIEPVDGYYEGPLKYVGIVNVRATNSFGAYLTQEYVIEGSIRGDIKLVREFKDYERDFIGRNDNFYKSYNAEMNCGWYVATPMEAENVASLSSWMFEN